MANDGEVVCEVCLVLPFYEYSYFHFLLIPSSQIISTKVVSLTEEPLSMVKANTPTPMGTNQARDEWLSTNPAHHV